MESRFNLLDEPWIPIEGVGKVSLKNIFRNSYVGVAGNPIQKMAVYKLLFLIAQRACNIETEDELVKKDVGGIARSCLEYLEAHRDCFFLYGDRPFLQYPELLALKNEQKTIYVDYIPGLSSENDSIIKQTQIKQNITDADKALLLLMLVSYSLGGKAVVKPKEYAVGTSYLKEKKLIDGRGESASASPSLGASNGFVQTLLLGNSILETIFLNLFTKDEIMELKFDSLDLSIAPPWERMPCFWPNDFNDKYKKSFVAWYLPMTRAVYLTQNSEIKYYEALCYKGEWIDPFLTVNETVNNKITVDILKKPWNQIHALLEQVYNVESRKQKYKCIAVNKHYLRARKYETFSIWTGGLGFENKSGEQFIKQKNDYLESSVTFLSENLGDAFFSRYRKIVDYINESGDNLEKKISCYRKQLGISKEAEKDFLNKAMFEFWHEMSKLSEKFIHVAESNSEELSNKLFVNIHNIERCIYDNYCPHGTSRQILAWAKNRP